MYTFSIIIPHKNSSRLLVRLLTSIPQDDMIQVIVVDDHSIVSESTCLNELQKKYSFELYVNTNIYAGGAFSKPLGGTQNTAIWNKKPHINNV